MKNRLGRGATIAAGAVAVSLFLLLCTLFYGPEDYLSPEKALARHDSLRFRIASGLVEPFGAGAFLALGIVFAWSVIAYFRESVGSVVPRLVGIAACVPSFCALTSLASDPHEFWAGSVGIWMGDLCFRGFGPFLAWTVVGSLFMVSFALATEFGFQAQWAALRGTLAFPLVPPAEPDPVEQPEEPAAAEPVVSQSTGTAVLEPGVDVPAEPWAFPEPDLGDSVIVDEEFSDAAVIDRDAHLVDVRRRMAAGETVTEEERRLVQEDRDRVEMGTAIDALFAGGPGYAPMMDPTITIPMKPMTFPPASSPATPTAPASALPDVPPFLLPSLYGQQMATDVPTPTDFLAPPAAPASAPTPSGTKHPTEDFGVPPLPLPARSNYVFAGVEFLPPNEELADPHADESNEADSTPAPAPAEPVAVDPVAAMSAFAAGAATADGPAAPAAEAAGVGETDFEDEIFAFGLMPDPTAAAAGAAAPHVEHAAAAAMVFTPEALPEVPPAVADAIAAPVPAELDEGADDGSWLLAAARDLGLEPVAEAEPVLAAEPVAAVEPVAAIDFDLDASWEIPARGGMTAEEAAEAIVSSLNDLFGDPIVLPAEAEVVPALASAEPPPLPEFLNNPALLPFMEPTVSATDVPAHAPPPGPAMPDSTLLPAFAAPAASTDDAPVFDPGEEILSPIPDAPRVYEPEPMTIEPEYMPNQSPEPGETVRFEAPAFAPEGATAGTPAAPVADAGPSEISETQFVEETLSPPEIELAPEPGEEPSPADEVLAKLFGEPVAAVPETAAAAPIIEELPAPVGPVQPEPREPPANLQPIIEEVVERVTLLNDPDFPDCARDHGIDTGPILDDQVFMPPAELVLDVPAAVAADEVIEEPAVDEALVSKLVEEFRADAAPAPEAVVESTSKPAGADDLYAQAVAAVHERGRGSVIVLQRKLGIGYTRAVKILEELVKNGVVGPENASGSHPVL